MKISARHFWAKSLYAICLSALLATLSACGRSGADKDISGYIEAWKTADQSQTQACRHFYTTDLKEKMEADTTQDRQQSYLDFLETLNGLRDYAKRNPSTRVEIRNTLYEVYGKLLYGSDKKEYLENLGLEALQKAVSLNDETLLAELYKMMADLTKDESLRSAIYDSKSIELLEKKDKISDFYTREDLAQIAEVFFKADDYKDAIKFGNIYLAAADPAKDSTLWVPYLKTMDIVGTSYMETNQWDSCSTVFENMLNQESPENDQTGRIKDIALGKLGIVQTRWQQYAVAEDNLEYLLDISQKSKDTANVIYALIGLGDLQINTGDSRGAISDLKQARRYAVTKRFASLQKKVYDKLAQAFEANSQEDSARACSRKIQKLEERIQEHRQQTEHLKTKTELELQQLQNTIETVQHEKVNKRNWLWLVIMIIALVAVIVVLIAGRRRFRTRIHRRLARQQEERTAKQAASELKDTVSKLKPTATADIQAALGTLSSDGDWAHFRELFCAAHPQFFNNLDKALGKRATTAYEKVAALLYLGLNNQQIGHTLCISKDSVARCKRRIRVDIGCEDLAKTIAEM